MSGLTAAAVRNAREAAGWSIAQAVQALRRQADTELPGHESLVRSWKRWEAGTAPSRFYQPLLTALFATIDAVNGEDILPDVSGMWFAAWQSWHDGAEVIGIQQVRCTQNGEHVDWVALDRGHPPGSPDTFTVEDGGYLWRGELRMWDHRFLMGWYAADDGSVCSKGAVHLALHPHGQKLYGRWVGLSYDGDTETGLGALARTEDDVRALIDQLREDS